MTKIGISSDTDIFKGKPTILSVKFGEQCEFVDANEFEGCTNLETINDDNVITSIGEYAFAGTNLKVVNFKKITELGKCAFEGCESLSDVNIPIVESIGYGAFQNCTELKTAIIDNTELNTPTPFETGDSDSTNPKTKIIGANAFAGCKKLKNINLDNCSEIGDGAFSGCESLNEIYLNCSIPMCAFKNCTNITQVTLSDGDSNGEEASIGEEAFSGCEKLSKVYLNNKFKLSNIDAFHHTTDETSEEENIICNITFYVSPEDYPVYTGDANELGWAKYKNYIVQNPESYQIIYVTKDNISIGINDDSENKVIGNIYYNDNTKYGILSLNEDIKTLNLSSILSDEGKKNLISIEYIPNSCTAIDEDAFAGCVNLPNFTIPDNIKKIGEGAFAGCANLTKFIRKNPIDVKVAYDGKAVISGVNLICVLPKDDSDTEGRICDISKIDKSIRRIGKSCFHGCKNMRRVDIPSTVSSIGDNAFEYCENLCEIHLTHSTPPTFGANIFEGVREDFKIFVPEESLENYLNNEGWSEYAKHIYPKPRNNDIIYYGDTKLDPTDTSISSSKANGNYYRISNMSNGILPQGYFTNKQSVQKVILGDNITKINNNAFKNCTKLDYIYLSDNVTQFNDECFYGCKNLKRIHIPFNLKTKYTYNQNDKFSGASSTITKDGFGNNVFYGCESLKEFGTYYKGCVSDDNRCYIYDSEIKYFAQGELTNYTTPNNITSISQYAFKGSKITSISISESTKNIGIGAFEGCTNLNEISLPSSLTNIGSNAFKECTNLNTISLPSSITNIGSSAFKECTNLNTISLPTSYGASLTNIGSSAFEGCTSLNEIILSPSLTNIGSSAFKGCTSLKKVSFGKSPKLEALSDSIFSGCSKLDEINLPLSLTKIGNSAFYECANLWETMSSQLSPQDYLEMPNSITNIGHHAFYGCDKITNIALPSKLEKIGTQCFVNEMHILNSGSTIMPMATFDNDYNITMASKTLTIYVLENLTSPPIFTNTNGIKDTTATPFGNPDSKITYINIPSNLRLTYLKNTYWKQYSNIFLT